MKNPVKPSARQAPERNPASSRHRPPRGRMPNTLTEKNCLGKPPHKKSHPPASDAPGGTLVTRSAPLPTPGNHAIRFSRRGRTCLRGYLSPAAGRSCVRGPQGDAHLRYVSPIPDRRENLLAMMSAPKPPVAEGGLRGIGDTYLRCASICGPLNGCVCGTWGPVGTAGTGSPGSGGEGRTSSA